MANACDTICSSIINSNDVKLCIMRKKRKEKEKRKNIRNKVKTSTSK